MKMNQKPFKYPSRQNRSRSIENNNCSSGREYDIFSKKVALKEQKERNLKHNDVNSNSSTDNEQDILIPMIRKLQFFNIQKEYLNVKCIRCSNSQPQNSGSCQHFQKSQSLPDQTKKGDGQDEPSYEQRKKIVLPKKKEYMNNKDHSFLKDGLYLEAFFYQLAVNGFLRHPITSSSPIISYFLIQLIVAYKQPDQIDILRSFPKEDEMIQYIEEILQDQQSQRYLSLKQFLGQENKIWGTFYQKMISYGHNILSSLPQESNFNYQLAIDDFIKYQQLVKPKFNEYIEYFQNDKYGKNNLAIGFLRFCFKDVVTGEKIKIRMPIGKFDQDCVINSDIVNLQTIQTYFGDSKYFSISSVIHSEKLMLFWLILHSSEIKEEVKIQLLQQIQSNTNFQALFSVWELNQVYVEDQSQESLQITEKNISNHFFQEFIQNYRLRSLKLESEGKRIIGIIVLIFTFTQLSDIQKQGIEQKLQIDDEKIEIQFHYSYFKRVMIDEIQTYPNEQQLLPYENQCFKRRYQKLNYGNQISLYDMDSEISSQLKFFDWKETLDLQNQSDQ